MTSCTNLEFLVVLVVSYNKFPSFNKLILKSKDYRFQVFGSMILV